MTIIFFIALLVYLVICGLIVTLILMQEGKGGGLSGVMGSSMGETFGFGGASKQIRKYTAICATVFFVMTILMTFLGEATFRSTASSFVGTDSAVPSVVPAPAPVTVTPAAGQPVQNNGATPGQVIPPADAPVPPPAAPASEAPATDAPASTPAP